MSGASIKTTLELWASSLRDVKRRMHPLFTQDRVVRSAENFLDGLLGEERRKTGRMRAEAAGDPGSWRQQAILGRGRWDADASVLAPKPAKTEPTTTGGVLAEAPATPRAIDPATGWLISPIAAAALCMKPRGQLTPAQAAKVATLKDASPDFVIMRGLAMRFRGILRSKNVKGLETWLNDAQRSGLFAIQRFVRTLRRDIEAVRNGVTETWSNGQTEGQINRLKTLKRSMFGRAGAELLRARMLPLSSVVEHGK
jgi:hypothetical protein